MKNEKSKRQRVLVLTQHYRPEPNFITADVAEALANRAQVTVVTAHPNYPYGRFYPGRKPWRVERTEENGVTVWRIPFFPDHSLSRVRRALSYLSFALIAALVAPLVAGRPHTVWVYHGPFTTGLAALWFKLVYGSRVIITCADLWPESFVAAGVEKRNLILRILYGYSRAINRVADLLICSTCGTMKRYREDGVPARKLRFVPVWVDGIGELPGVESRAEAAEPRIVYAGNVGPAQKLDSLVEAAAQLRREGIAVQFDIYGTGASEDDLRRLVAERDATNVTFHGRVSPAEAFAAASGAFAQYVALQPSPLFRMSIPSKLFFAFAAATPLLYALEGEAGELTEESGGGIRFDAEDPASLVAAIKVLLALPAAERLRMRQRLREFYDTNFERSTLIGEYLELLGATPLILDHHPVSAQQQVTSG